jgi:cation transport ATPase
MFSVMKDKIAILDLKGANCASCSYTIEHLGRKVEGVRDVRVIPGKAEVHVEYGGNPGSLEKITEIVRRIGYNATIRWDSITDGEMETDGASRKP